VGKETQDQLQKRDEKESFKKSVLHSMIIRHGIYELFIIMADILPSDIRTFLWGRGAHLNFANE
jgi:hypothetical protein